MLAAWVVAALLVGGAAEARQPAGLHRRAADGGVPAVALSPVDTCLAAVAEAEMKHGTPPGLLLAIARAESGRYDAKTKQVQPWPWAINTNGVGSFLPSKDEAVSYVSEAVKTNGSVDTGCMQVNLQQHPRAFRTIAEAFDPSLNADYAARYLVQLHAETGDWLEATGFYHSHTPALAVPYRMAIQARLGGFVSLGKAILPRPLTAEEVLRAKLAQSWAVTLTEPGSGEAGLTEGPPLVKWQLATTRLPPPRRIIN